MTKEEHKNIKDSYYEEALNYINNANETLKKAKKEGSYYKVKKYVRTACRTAYLGVLLAMDGILLLKGKPVLKRKDGRADINEYRKRITEIDKSILNALNSSYNVLHLDGYYDGITSVKIIQDGFEEAMKIINKLK